MKSSPLGQDLVRRCAALMLSWLLYVPGVAASSPPSELAVFEHFWEQAVNHVYPEELASAWFNEQGYHRLRKLAAGSSDLAELARHINNFLLDSAIPNARFYTPSDMDYYLFQSFQASGTAKRQALHHIGLFASLDEGRWIVTAVLDGYPAQQAGLRRGDILLSVDDRPFHPVYSFRQAERDSRSFTHQLRYRRQQSEHTVTVQSVYENLYDSLRSATLHSVNQFVSGNKRVAYVRLWSLSRSLNDQLTYLRMLGSLQHTDALIIDLRDSFGYSSPVHTDPFFASRSSYPTVVNETRHQVEDSENFGQEAAAGVARRVQLPGRRDMSIAQYERPVVVIANENTRAGMELYMKQLKRSRRVLSTGTTTAGFIASAENLLSDPAQSYFVYLPQSRLLIDEQEPEGRGVEVLFEQAYPLHHSSAVDPQFETALYVLFGVM